MNHKISKVLAARRISRLEELKVDLEARYGVRVMIAKLDIANAAAADAFYEDLPVEVRENVDVLVNNAGFSGGSRSIADTNWEEMTGMIDTNVKGIVKMAKLFVPGMLKRQAGHIINVGSVCGKDSVANAGIYCGTKHMIEAITNSLRAEVVATPLRVSMISPGWTDTEFWVTALGGDEEKAAAISSGFQALSGADVADSIVFMASRPLHVQVVDLTICPTAQASVSLIHRETAKS